MEEGCGERRDEMKGKRRGGRKSLKTRREEMGNKSRERPMVEHASILAREI